MDVNLVPNPIREWFGSEQLLDEVESINTTLELNNANQLIIPYELAELEIKKISIKDFYSNLKTKMLPFVGEAKTEQAIQAINEKILAPIRVDLINFGVLPADWALTAVPATQPAETLPLSQTEQPVVEEQPTEEPISALQTVQAQAAAPEILKPSFKNEPFVFHQAEKLQELPAQPEQPSFGIGYKITEPDDVTVKKQQTPPTEPVPQTPPTTEPKTRVVNYSEFRTPLEKTKAIQPFAEPIPTNQQTIPPQNIVNLKKSEQVSTEPGKETPGNTINLKDLPL